MYPVPFLEYCADIGPRLTSLRKSVLFILWDTEKPLKAYEILEKLQSRQNAQAPTVYRVLDYFVSSGVVHKIESIQSYTLCCEPDKHLPSEILMVCNQCYQVQEVYDKSMRALVQEVSLAHHFHIGQDAIELRGICKACAGRV